MQPIIKIYPSNVTFNGINHFSILDAALQAKVILEHSCKNGYCGLCKATLIKGEVVDGQGNTFTTGQQFLTCQCKSNSDELIIDAVYYPELTGQVRKVTACKVVSVIKQNDFLIIKFRLPPSAQFSYLPGQFVNLIYQGVTRSYSIANADVTQGIELHVRRVDNGAMSNLLFNDVKPETLMRLDGPIGTFFVREDARPIIFLAGGTGFAPVQAMIEGLLAKRIGRYIHIYWGMSNSRDFYSKLPSVWARQHSNIKFVPVVSGDDVNWTGRTGFVHHAVLEDLNDLSQYCVYACGSPNMIEAAKNDFIKHGLTSKQFFSDAFTASK
ncbi:MAG: FAD-binding oxidoreductase [Enterovibrio sp.]